MSRNLRLLLIALIAILMLAFLRSELIVMNTPFATTDISDSSREVFVIESEPEEPLEFDEDGETLETGNPPVSSPATTLPEVREILPSKNSNQTLESLWGMSTNEEFMKKEKINDGIHIIVSFYRGTYKQERFKEILMALRRNLKNPNVKAVHTLWEDVDPIVYINNTALADKLIRVNFGVQPTYKDLFDYANLRLGRGAVGIVTNSDIYFDDTLACVTAVTPDRAAFNATQHLVYSLSRHPSDPCAERSNYCEDYIGSHDSFVFALPLPPKFSSRIDFTQNHIAAENVVIWEFRRLPGYVVKNPCQVVKSYHIHCTNERHYTKGAISRGRNRIGKVDRHASIMPSKVRCKQVLY